MMKTLKILLVLLLCICLMLPLPVTAEWELEDPAVALARRELTALGCDLTGYEVFCDPQTDKVVFSWPEGKGDRLVAWGEFPEKGEPYLLAFLAQGYGSLSGRRSPFPGKVAVGLRLAAFSWYITDPSPWLISHTPGDVDGDEEVTSTDARLVLIVSVAKSRLYTILMDRYDRDAAMALQFVDVDGDGKVTSTDARLILQYAIGKIDAFPQENHSNSFGGA